MIFERNVLTQFLNNKLSKMKKAKSIKYLFGVLFTALIVTLLPSCEEEEAKPPSYNPVAGFSFEINEENVKEVS